ncbi:glycoside hydrolase family 130 protein [Candidatus Aerophobetes bacterium]|nr:glycoside hydrolase family 130 protein [Candidatus Aerophobetes bacterium]
MPHIHKYPKDIVKRYGKNPIITRDDIPFPCNTVFNAGAIKYQNQYLLLLRVETLEGWSCLVLARSKDGYNFEVEKEPVIKPAQKEPFATYEKRGVEDPRITLFEDGRYYIFYTAYSKYAPRIALVETTDFKSFRRIGLVSEPGNKDAVLFPRKINNLFVRFDRPSTGGAGDMWISYSPDLIYWGKSKVVMEARPGFWDSDKIGAGAPPVETNDGWLEIYHGVKGTGGGKIYRLGYALFDLKDPSKLIGRSQIPLISPREMYERTGDVPNVIFTCGAVVEAGGEIKIYYGAADTCICVATCKLQDLVESCH